MSRLRLVRDLAALTAGELLGKVAGFLAFAWLARVLSPEGYGAVELAASLLLFFGLVVDFGVGQIGAREIARAPERAAALVGQLPALRILTALVAVPAMAGTALFLGQPARTVHLVWIFSLALLFVPFFQRFLLQGLDRMPWLALAQASRMLFFAGGVVLLVRSEEHLLRVGVLEIGAAGLVALYHLGVQLRLGFAPRLHFTGLAALLREAWPVGAEQIAWSFNQFAPTLLVAWLLGGDEIAWFGSSQRIVMSLGTFVALYHLNLYPTLARRAGNPVAVQALVGPSLRITAWLGTTAALVLCLLAEPLLRIAFGARFAIAAPTFAMLAWVLPISLLSGHARFALIASGNQKLELWAQLLGAGITIGTGVFLVPKLGGVGAALTMIVATSCVWVVAHGATRYTVARLPFFGPLWRPAVAAAAGALAATQIAPHAAWAQAGIACGSMLLAAPLLDRRLLADARALAEAKSFPQPHRPGAPPANETR